MSDELEQRLTAGAHAVRERELAGRRAAELTARGEELSSELDRLREQYAVGQHEVERLEGRSLARVLASLAGSRDDKLARERAEAQAARYRVAQAVDRLEAVRRERDQAARRSAQLADAPAEYEAALAARERFLLAGPRDPRAGRLLALAAERGRLSAQIKEEGEAAAAAAAALEALDAVRQSLDSAAGWSTYDTWFGGGIVASSVKHTRMDEAADAAATADRQLAVLRSELADVTEAGVIAPLPVSAGTRFADIWLDNFFTDLSVDSRIRQASDNVEATLRQVSDVRDRMAAAIGQAQDRLTAIEAERRSLLAP